MTKRYDAWTEQEESILQKLYGYEPLATIQKALNNRRSARAIQIRASRLRLTIPRPPRSPTNTDYDEDFGCGQRMFSQVWDRMEREEAEGK